MLTKDKTTTLYALLEQFIDDVTETGKKSEESDEIEILSNALDYAIKLKNKIEPLL